MDAAEIEARARAAQSGRWPRNAVGISRLLLRSSASVRFVATARRDVLWLCKQLRKEQKQ